MMRLVLLSALLLPGALLGQKQPAASHASPVVWRAPGDTNPDHYAGDELCSACHAPEGGQFAKTVHAKAAPASATYGTGCESCHGPGKAHVEAMSAGDTEAGKKLIFRFNG
ncbi:MAG TPA: hypothetical protein VE958_06500, partial [Bryobacteraceae bacterium]|nr:hypothetical protein [Bryobacteraceae bacterium]